MLKVFRCVFIFIVLLIVKSVEENCIKFVHYIWTTSGLMGKLSFTLYICIVRASTSDPDLFVFCVVDSKSERNLT